MRFSVSGSSEIIAWYPSCAFAPRFREPMTMNQFGASNRREPRVEPVST